MLPPPPPAEVVDALRRLGWVPFTTRRHTVAAYDKDNPAHKVYGEEARHLLESGGTKPTPAASAAASPAPATAASGDIEKAEAVVTSKPPDASDEAAPAAPTADHLHAAAHAVARLASKSHDLARMADVRPALEAAGVKGRATQDAALKALWKAGVLSGQGYEGRHGTPEEKQRHIDAAMPDPGGGHPIGQFVLKPGWQQALARLTGRHLGTLPISDLPPARPGRETLRGNGARPHSPAPSRLSTAPGGRDMADEKDDRDDELFDDIDDESEGEGGDEEEMGGAAGEGPPAKGKDDDYLKELGAELMDMGIHVPEGDTNPKDFCKHLLTAIKTHKATKQAMGDQGGAGGGTAESGGAAEEETPMMMSTQRLSELQQHADPAVRELAGANLSLVRRAQASEEKANRREAADLIHDIDALEKLGAMKPARAEKLRNETKAVFLSGVRRDAPSRRRQIKEIVSYLKDTPAAARLSTRRGRPVPLPPANEAEAAEDKDIQEVYTGKRDRIAPVNGLAKE